MEANYFTILYWFCHTSTWIHHGCTRVPHPEPSSHLPPRTIPLGHPSAPAPSILYPASNLDWRFVSYMILYVFRCHSPKSSLLMKENVNVDYIVICHCHLVAKLCLTLCDLMDCSPPGSSVHGISQAKILEWVAISISRGSSWPRDRTHVFCIGR